MALYTSTDKPKLLDQVRFAIRAKHYSIRTEEAYVHWAKRYILFHNKRHPKAMREREVGQFLNHLAVREKVSSSTHLLESGSDWRSPLRTPLRPLGEFRTVQELLGHKDVTTTQMSHSLAPARLTPAGRLWRCVSPPPAAWLTHVLNRPGLAVRSPLDG